MAFRPSYRRFNRTALEYILRSRSCIGEIVPYPAKFAPLMSRATFDTCQDVLRGRNRRTATPDLPDRGGLFRCAHCGATMTGERDIDRRMEAVPRFEAERLYGGGREYCTE